MPSIYLLMIVASAFMHALYNGLLKQGEGDRRLLPGFFIVATVIAWALVLREGGLDAINWSDLPTVYLAALFYVMYQLCCSKAYQQGEISALYPLTVLGPVLIPIWAGVFLGERLGTLALLGIGLTVCGAISMKLKSLTRSEARKAFRLHDEYSGARWALAASLVYSVGAIFDKASVQNFSGTTYLAFILSLMTVNMLVALSLSKDREKQAPHLPFAWKSMLLGGVALYLSFMFFRVALKEVYVSIATPIRQVSILFAMGFGAVILKERINRNKLAGASLILSGVLLLAQR